MTGAIAFTLYGPLSSWGTEHAASERRPSAERPTKSAVVGILAACLGIRREDRGAITALSDGLAMAVLTVCPGEGLVEFHTVQTGGLGKSVRPATRRAELGAMKATTVITRRQYRQDALHVVLLRVRDGADIDLGDVAAAMRKPHFAPYLGRKCCPLALPLDPVECAGTSPGDELAAYVRRLAAMEVVGLPVVAEGTLAADLDFGLVGPGAMIESRNDAAVALERGFAARDEVVLTVEIRTREPQEAQGARWFDL